MENVTKIDLDNLDREDLEYGVEAAKQILKEYEDKLQQVIEQEEAQKAKEEAQILNKLKNTLRGKEKKTTVESTSDSSVTTKTGESQ